MAQSLAELEMVGMRSDTEEIYPPGTPMTYWRITAERTALRLRLAALDARKMTCKTCEHFGGAKNFNRCSVFDDVPPAEFQDQDGKCNSWVSDGVPF